MPAESRLSASAVQKDTRLTSTTVMVHVHELSNQHGVGWTQLCTVTGVRAGPQNHAHTLPLSSVLHVLMPQTARFTFVPLIRRTSLLNWYYRALGCTVGRNVVIDTDDLQGYDNITLKDDCVLDAACGVTAITFKAGKPADQPNPRGLMRVAPTVVGARAVVGPHAMVVAGSVPDDAVVLPCSATSNPQARWSGSSRPASELKASVRTQESALGAAAGLAAVWTTSLLLKIATYPVLCKFQTYGIGYEQGNEGNDCTPGSRAWQQLLSPPRSPQRGPATGRPW